MKRKYLILGLLLIIAALFTGCNIRTVDQLYCLPVRPDAHLNLQSAMDEAMTGLEYFAPVSGENQQTVQSADLNGDKEPEYLVFARGVEDKKLRILIFTAVDEEYVLADTIERSANAFENVQYVRFSDTKGYDLVFGCQLTDTVARRLSVYKMRDKTLDDIEGLSNLSYSHFVCADLDKDGLSELLVLRADEYQNGNGIAELYQMGTSGVERFKEASMSEPVDHIKRIMVSKLSGGNAAVYVASDVDGSAIITDVFAVVNEDFTNVSFSNESGTSVQTLRNYYVYADDIDSDGELELPDLIPMQSAPNISQEEQYLIRWYSMTPDGKEIDKMFTYHNYLGGWFLELNQNIVNTTLVNQLGNSFVFNVKKDDGTLAEVMTIYVFTGHQREDQAVADNRFVLHRNETTVYAAHLGVESAAYNITKDSLVHSFRLIVQDWKAGET